MSDTHSLTSHIKQTIPDGDVFIHAGDFTRCGSLPEVRDFINWVNKLPHKHKILIAGNHELTFDPGLKDADLSVGCNRIGQSPVALSQKLFSLSINQPRLDLDELKQVHRRTWKRA